MTLGSIKDAYTYNYERVITRLLGKDHFCAFQTIGGGFGHDLDLIEVFQHDLDYVRQTRSRKTVGWKGKHTMRFVSSSSTSNTR